MNVDYWRCEVLRKQRLTIGYQNSNKKSIILQVLYLQSNEQSQLRVTKPT